MTVVDTNVLLRGGERLNEPKAPVSVRKEIVSESVERDLSKVEFQNPGEESLESVMEKARKINSPTSVTDNEVVALALELSEKIVSDDLAVQNLAAHLDVEFDSFMDDRIEEKREWEPRCSSCGREASGERCPVCGGAVDRKTSSREALREKLRRVQDELLRHYQ